MNCRSDEIFFVFCVFYDIDITFRPSKFGQVFVFVAWDSLQIPRFGRRLPLLRSGLDIFGRRRLWRNRLLLYQLDLYVQIAKSIIPVTYRHSFASYAKFLTRFCPGWHCHIDRVCHRRHFNLAAQSGNIVLDVYFNEEVITLTRKLLMRNNMNHHIQIARRAAIASRMPLARIIKASSVGCAARNFHGDDASIYIDAPRNAFVDFKQVNRDFSLNVFASFWRYPQGADFLQLCLI